MDDAFFEGFHSDLQDGSLWEEFNKQHNKGKKALKDLPNPTQLGDHVSLKAEAADSRPAENDPGSTAGEEGQEVRGEGKKSLKELANPSQLGDPTSLKAETEHSSPTEHDKGAQSNPKLTPNDSSKQPRPSLSKLAKDTTIGDPVSIESEEVLGPPPSSSSSSSRQSKPAAPTIKPTSGSPNLPSLPKIDSTALFWSMMRSARSPDPYIFPALQRLAALPKEKRPIIAALSNTVIFPSGNDLSKPISFPASPTVSSSSSLKDESKNSSVDPMSTLTPYFDIFLSSSQLGMRKPEPRIYKHALSEISSTAAAKKSTDGGDNNNNNNKKQEIKAEDIVFLDDIGENLRIAREHGWRTIKVQMGKTFRAVKELEIVMGLRGQLIDEKVARAKL